MEGRTSSSPAVDTYVAEVVSILERSLCFMHTGSARVIHTSTMGRNALFPGASLVEHGTVLFSKAVSITSKFGLKITPGLWPRDATGLAKSSASRSAQFAYNDILEQVGRSPPTPPQFSTAAPS